MFFISGFGENYIPELSLFVSLHPKRFQEPASNLCRARCKNIDEIN